MSQSGQLYGYASVGRHNEYEYQSMGSEALRHGSTAGMACVGQQLIIIIMMMMMMMMMITIIIIIIIIHEVLLPALHTCPGMHYR